MSCQHESLARL